MSKCITPGSPQAHKIPYLRSINAKRLMWIIDVWNYKMLQDHYIISELNINTKETDIPVEHFPFQEAHYGLLRKLSWDTSPILVYLV